MTQPIQEVFKQFCKERHAEDKGRNHDLLQEIYASTEFFDVSLYEIVGIGFNLEQQGKNYTTTYTIENFNLPFQNNFVKVFQDTYMFIREYTPDVITGTVYTIVTEDIHFNAPFTIRLEGDKATLISNLDIPNSYNATDFISQTFHIVIGVCMTLTELSHKAIAVDKPSNPNLHEYYRRKRKPTIKIPQRPIYYILGDKKEDVTPKYKNIRVIGNLEYSYSFHVRGHWRRIGEKTLGKDRNGNYNMHGYTWVTEYIKGEGELAKRIRVVK